MFLFNQVRTGQHHAASHPESSSLPVGPWNLDRFVACRLAERNHCPRMTGADEETLATHVWRPTCLLGAKVLNQCGRPEGPEQFLDGPIAPNRGETQHHPQLGPIVGRKHLAQPVRRAVPHRPGQAVHAPPGAVLVDPALDVTTRGCNVRQNRSFDDSSVGRARNRNNDSWAQRGSQVLVWRRSYLREVARKNVWAESTGGRTGPVTIRTSRSQQQRHRWGGLSEGGLKVLEEGGNPAPDESRRCCLSPRPRLPGGAVRSDAASRPAGSEEIHCGATPRFSGA